MRYMDLGGLDVYDLGADDVVGFANDYDDGTGLGISIGGIFRGIKKGVTAPFKGARAVGRVAFKGARAVGRGVVKGAKFVAKRPYLLAPVALAIPGVAPAAFAAAKFAGKRVGKVVTAPVKLAGRVFGRRRPAVAPTQADQAAQAREKIQTALARERTWYHQDTGEAVKGFGPPDRSGKWKLTKPLFPGRPAITPPAVTDIVSDRTKTREEKRAGLRELLGKISGEILTRDATGAALPEGVTPPAARIPTAPVSPEEEAAAAEAGAPGATLAGLFQGPALPLLAGVAALALFGGRGGRGGGRRRRRNPLRRRRRQR